MLGRRRLWLRWGRCETARIMPMIVVLLAKLAMPVLFLNRLNPLESANGQGTRSPVLACP
jgi:hypothetical protein